MRCDDSGTLKPWLGWIGAWGALKGENVMFWSEAKVPSTGGHDVTALDTDANEGCHTWLQTRGLPSLLWSDVPGTVGFEETVLLKGSNAGCKTRLRTICLPSVNVLLLPPFRFLVPTFLPAFFGMFTFAIAERLGERLLPLNQFKFRNSLRTPIFSAAAKVCEHILFLKSSFSLGRLCFHFHFLYDDILLFFFVVHQIHRAKRPTSKLFFHRVFQKFVPIINCILRKAFNASLSKFKLIQVRNLSK